MGLAGPQGVVEVWTVAVDAGADGGVPLRVEDDAR